MKKQTPPAKNIHTLERLVVETVDIDSITPNNYNPNRQSDREFELLCRSIEEDGFTQPIIVNKTSKQIVDGEHRWRALKALGRTKAEIVYVDFTREQMLISTLRHNRARGQENIVLAADVLRDLQRLGALDIASDSLLLDDVELRIMLDDVAQSELTLRTEGDQLSVEEVQAQLVKEKQHAAKKEEEDLATGEREKASTFTVVLRYYQYEQRQVLLTLAEIPGTTDSDKALWLINKYKDDPKAKERMLNPDPLPWTGK